VPSIKEPTRSSLVPRSERFTTPSLDGIELHTSRIDRPGATTLVLLHGGGANAHWWDHLAPRLAEHFRVISLDFRGHGDSDHPEFREPGAFDRDLDALLEHVEAPDAILMGHSMGAHVALRAATRHPRLRAIVAVEPSRGGRRGERRRTRLALAASRTYATRDEAIRRFQFLPTAPLAPEALRSAIAGHSVRQEADGRYGYKFDPGWFGIGGTEPPELSRIVCPVLIVRGSESSLLSAQGAAEWINDIANASVVEIPGGGHNIHIECPDEVLAAVDAFVASFR
jgi:pimeloyl-ACP methyl ester carboxylesterase